MEVLSILIFCHLIIIGLANLSDHQRIINPKPKCGAPVKFPDDNVPEDPIACIFQRPSFNSGNPGNGIECTCNHDKIGVRFFILMPGSAHILVTSFLVFRHLGCMIFCMMFSVCKSRWARQNEK